MLTGHISAGRHRLALRVHYEDTDFAGHVYHANYLKFCERGRSDLLRMLGIDQNAMMAAEALLFVVRRMACDFLKPARFDDVLSVDTTPGDMAGARLELAQAVLRADDLLFSARVTVVLIDGRGRPRRIPRGMAEKFHTLQR
jgi:acyl-CoA thioester hydrolase